MKTYARIQDGLVAELLQTDGDITSLFNPALVLGGRLITAGHCRRLAFRRNELHSAIATPASCTGPDDCRVAERSLPH